MGNRITLPQASELTGLSHYTLRQGCKNGRFPYLRVGLGKGKIIFDQELLEQYIQQEMLDNMVKSKPEQIADTLYMGRLRQVKA